MKRTGNRGGVGLFLLFLLLFLAALGAAAYFFLVHPKGKKALAGALRQFLKTSQAVPGPAAETPPGPADNPQRSRPEQPPPAPQTPPSPDRSKVQVYRTEAGKALADGDLKLARKFINQALRLAPNDPDALVLEVEIRRAEIAASARTGKTEPGPARQTPADRAASLRKKVRAFLAAGDIETAEQYARKAVDLAPDDPEAVELLKSVLLAKKEALKPAAPPADPAAEAARFVKVARTCEENGDFASASAFFRKALELDPDNPDALRGLKRVAAALKDKTERTERLNRQLEALRQEISRAKAELEAKKQARTQPSQTARLEEKIRRLEEAVRAGAGKTARALDDNKSRAAALLSQARNFLLSGARSTAREIALKALALDPGNPSISEFIARMDRERREAAAATQAPPAPPAGDDREKAAALLSKAKELHRSGSPAAARDVALKALALDPGNSEAADFLKLLEEEQRARTSKPAAPGPESAEDAARNKAAALLEQARKLLASGAPDSARDLAMKALDLDPHNSSISEFIASVEKQLAAAAPAPKAPPAPPEDALSKRALELLAAARTLRKQGALESALSAARKAVELDPSNPDITSLIAALEKEIASKQAPAPKPAPEPGPKPPAAPYPSPDILEKASALVSSLDDALQKGDREKYLSALSPELAAAERDNLVEFLRIAGNIRVSRRGDPTPLKPGPTGAMRILWPYTLTYSVNGHKITRNVEAVYTLAETPGGGLKIQSVENRPSPKNE